MYDLLKICSEPSLLLQLQACMHANKQKTTQCKNTFVNTHTLTTAESQSSPKCLCFSSCSTQRLMLLNVSFLFLFVCPGWKAAKAHKVFKLMSETNSLPSNRAGRHWWIFFRKVLFLFICFVSFAPTCLCKFELLVVQKDLDDLTAITAFYFFWKSFVKWFYQYLFFSYLIYEKKFTDQINSFFHDNNNKQYKQYCFSKESSSH